MQDLKTRMVELNPAQTMEIIFLNVFLEWVHMDAIEAKACITPHYLLFNIVFIILQKIFTLEDLHAYIGAWRLKV